MSITSDKFSQARDRTGDQLQKAVQAELHWDTHITDASGIGISVSDGVLTLSGQVASYAEKMAAQDAAHRVTGVKDVANDITVAYPGHLNQTDAEIAHKVRHTLEWDTLVPEQRIQSTVEHGWVTLKGMVTNWSQRADVERAIRNLSGIRGVTNSITVTSPEPDTDAEVIRQSIEAAIDRQTEQEIKQIGISVKDGTVILTGTVRSTPEKLAATSAAGFAPGVRHVENHLIVDPSR